MSKYFKCGVCGYVHEGDNAPEVCPKCGAPKEKYEVLGEDAVALIIRSSKTNLLHMNIVDLLMKADSLASAGIEDNLDPNCVKAFNAVKTQAKVLKGLILAELEGHMKKGKWGI